MTTFIISTTQEPLVVGGDHYARDESGDLHVYPDGEDSDPVTTVDADTFVGIVASTQSVADVTDALLGDSLDDRPHIIRSDY